MLNMPCRILLATALAALAAAQPAAAGPCAAKSGPRTAALVELYTSEGCSSCPPAERWLSGLRPEARRRGEIVPLAMHVGYWDYLGWKDAYARPEFVARQRRIAALQQTGVIYTPQVVLQGRDFRGWGSGVFERAVADINARPAQASISLSLARQSDGELSVKADAQVLEGGQGAGFFLAAYESGLVSHIEAGENQGRTLRHDFVVRDWAGPIAFGPDGRLHASRRLSLPERVGFGDSGVAAFVQDPATGRILQALQLPACPG